MEGCTDLKTHLLKSQSRDMAGHLDWGRAFCGMVFNGNAVDQAEYVVAAEAATCGSCQRRFQAEAKRAKARNGEHGARHSWGRAAVSWDDVDEWRRQQAVKRPSKTKPGNGPSAAFKTHRRIENGFHPWGVKLREPPGETCGSCAQSYRITIGSGAGYWKCRLKKATRGPGSDLRLKWPACFFWEAKQ